MFGFKELFRVGSPVATNGLSPPRTKLHASQIEIWWNFCQV